MMIKMELKLYTVNKKRQFVWFIVPKVCSRTIYRVFRDSGNALKNGAMGILMSLPELAFFNIRKGSYKHLVPPTTE